MEINATAINFEGLLAHTDANGRELPSYTGVSGQRVVLIRKGNAYRFEVRTNNEIGFLERLSSFTGWGNTTTNMTKIAKYIAQLDEKGLNENSTYKKAYEKVCLFANKTFEKKDSKELLRKVSTRIKYVFETLKVKNKKGQLNSELSETYALKKHTFYLNPASERSDVLKQLTESARTALFNQGENLIRVNIRKASLHQKITDETKLAACLGTHLALYTGPYG